MVLYYFVFLVFFPLYCLQTVVCVNISRHVSCRWVVILHFTPRAIIISILVGTNLWAFAGMLASSHVFQMQTASPVVSRLTKDSIGRYTGGSYRCAKLELSTCSHGTFRRIQQSVRLSSLTDWAGVVFRSEKPVVYVPRQKRTRTDRATSRRSTVIWMVGMAPGGWKCLFCERSCAKVDVSWFMK